MTQAPEPRTVDVHALPALFSALRLPSFQTHWEHFAKQADTENWPAAKLLATLAEIEMADREERRIRRHLSQSKLPGGKTLATFDFKPVPRPATSPDRGARRWRLARYRGQSDRHR